MTDTDRMSPVFALTASEREMARQRILADPEALWPLVRATLGVERAEATIERMAELIREVR